MEIWLKQGDEELRLPILPPSYELSYQQNNTEVNISNYGTVNLIGKRGLGTTTLSSFFPKRKYSAVQYKGFPKPKECVDLIESWRDIPVKYLVAGKGINLNMTIEQFTYSEQDATGDIYYTIQLKEYRIPKLTVKKTAKTADKTTKKIATVENAKRVNKTVKTTQYTVKQGDTLCSIAKKLTGDSNNYRAIANQNNIKNPNKIYVGQKLVIKV